MRWPGLREHARAALVLDRRRPDWGAGLRAAVIVALPLVPAAAFDRLDIGLFATFGALNVALADPGGRYDLRVAATSVATALMAFALAVTTLLAPLPVAAVVALGCWAFAMALVGELGPAGPSVSFVSLVLFIIGLGLPDDPSQLGFRLLWFLVGCAAGVLVTSSLWPLRPDAPARTALSTALTELATFLRSMPHTAGERVLRRDRIADAIDEARTATAHRVRGRGHHSAHYATALNIADDVQQGLGPLDRTFGALDPPPPALVDTVAAVADGCDELADCLRGDRAWEPATIEDAARRLDAADLRGDAAVARDVLTTMAADLARPHLTNLGDRDPRAEARRARHGLAALVHPGSVVFRHAVRLAVVVAVAQWLSFVDPFGKSYWIPLTAAVVLKPTFATTVERGVQRIVGTILGVLVAFVATWLIGDREWALIAAFVGLTFALAALLEVNYALAVTGLTPAVILLLSIDGSTADLELDRLFGTVVGGAVALVGGYLLWPAWARFDLGTTLGRGASVEAHYLSTVTDLGRSPEQMRATHRDAERARSNADATVRRMLAEPPRQRVDPDAAMSFCGRLDGLVETTTGLRVALRAAAAPAAPAPLPASALVDGAVLAESRDTLLAAARVLGGDDPRDAPPATGPVPAPAAAAGGAASHPVGEVAVLAQRIRRDAAGLGVAAGRLARDLLGPRVDVTVDSRVDPGVDRTTDPTADGAPGVSPRARPGSARRGRT